ncbi:hypothetical protein [Streptomyces puniciscabiei]|uniref:hypothetical protein n=1 Tax=Streptomyces puniciscabiei TaxID=164348 RepID=UPI00332D944A
MPALEVPLTELATDPAGQAPGRFGSAEPEPELALHHTETHRTPDRTDRSRSPAEASDQPTDAAQRASHV